ncbi:MAG TPA: glycosyltransferase [Candidatus Acidoferrum sp.]|nr:glycosyltransferase [Candidatus Acidoferrum sp.]
MSERKPRVAIVSDPLVQRGGAERCVEVLAQTFPDAPIFAVLYSAQTGPASIARRVTQSGLGRVPGATRRHRWLLPLYPGAVEGFDLGDYDVILSSHHTAAKGIVRHARQHHICYCHTPMRALWERPFDEIRSLPAPARPFAAGLMRQLRVWDYVTAARVDEFIANSETTRARIAKHYGRTSRVVHPPIDLSRFSPGGGRPADGDKAYYLVASRLVPYKRVDLAVAATAAVGRKLVVVGTGPGLRDIQAPHVTHLGHVSDVELRELMRGARAMIFPPFEDFGMAPVEMMACGRPVIAYGAGGALETVVDGVTGVFAAEQTVHAFAAAIARLEELQFDPQRIRAHAERFSQERFVETMRELVDVGYERLRGSSRDGWRVPARDLVGLE